MAYQPKTGQKCYCKPGIQRDNCPACEGTGWRIDFAAIRAHTHEFKRSKPSASVETCSCGKWRFTENAGPSIEEVR